MILSVLLLTITMLLLPFSCIKWWQVDKPANLSIADSVSAKPLMTGVRLTAWDGQRQLFVLQVESLEFIWKTLGPLQLEDQRDLSANNCYLRSDSASLSGNLQEIKRFLFSMLISLKKPTPKPLSASSPQSKAKPVAYTENLVGLPPTLKAGPFTCVISQPQGIETIFQADLATFYPGQTDITLEGNVQVKGGNQACLTAEHVVWSVTQQELNVEEAYRFQNGEREIKGREACFSLTGGRLEPVKIIKTQTLPYLRDLPSSGPLAPCMISARGQNLPAFKKNLIDLSRLMLQTMSATVEPTDQRLTSAKNQGKEACFSSSKPNVYPPAPMTYSLEETFDRELFCEKSR
jgi:hypothetical protein